MKIVAEYDFNGGREYLARNYPAELREIKSVIVKVEAERHKTKRSREKTMLGAALYSPRGLNDAFKAGFHAFGWGPQKVPCSYEYGDYLEGYIPSKAGPRAPFREMDFLKPPRKIGVEVQFGKYAFMVYNVCAKMTIFKNLGFIDAGVEIVPVKRFAESMSTGVSYFEQFAWDLAQRGKSNIDIPVLILGLDA